MNAHEVWCVLARVGFGVLAVAAGLAAFAGWIALISWAEDRFPSLKPGPPGRFGMAVIALWALGLFYAIGNKIAERMGWC